MLQNCVCVCVWVSVAVGVCVVECSYVCVCVRNDASGASQDMKRQALRGYSGLYAGDQ